MRWLYKLFLRFRSLFHKNRVEQELRDELRFHLDRLIEERVAQGMAAAEARYAGLRELGGLERIKEECRDMRGTNYLDNFFQDIRYGLRRLAKSPGFTALAVLSLALGIGANTAIFSVLNAVVLRPLPYQDPGRLAVLWTDNLRKNLHEERTSYPNFEDWKKQNRVFEDMAFCSSFTVNLTDEGEPERIVAARVTSNLFPMLGVSPILGHTFALEDEARGNRVIVLSYGLWQRRFASSREVLGRSLEIEGARSVVIGVMPAIFQLPGSDVQFWEPHEMFPGWTRTKFERGVPSGYVVGRLKPGVTFPEAQTDMNLVGSRLARRYPDLASNTDFFGFAVSVVPLSVQITGKRRRTALWVLFAAVVLVLLIACANVANLFLARGAGRQQELAVRAALGAGRGRLVRQLLTESLLLSFASGGLGLAFAAFGVRASVRLAPQDVLRVEQVGADPAVFGFALVLSMLTGILFGLAPAWEVSKSDPHESLKNGGRGLAGELAIRRTHGLLVISEYALAVVLLAGAGLLIRSLLRVQAVNPGFRPERVLIARVVQSSIKPEAQWAELYPQALSRIMSIPGVQAAGAIDNFLFQSNPDETIIPEGKTVTASGMGVDQVMGDGISADYFRVVGVPLLKGRFFSEQDGPNSPRVAIINQTMARRFWPGDDPIGKRFRFGFQKPTDPWISVVGVVGDMRRDGLTRAPVSQAFLPLTQNPARGMDFVVRAASDPWALAAAVRSAIRSVDKTAPVFNVSTLDEQLREQTAPMRFETALLGAFATLAMLLAAIGIYAITRYSVAQRTHEIGVRIALGAKRVDVLTLVVGHALQLTLAGVGIGLVGAVALTRFLSSLLYEVKPTDLSTYVIVPLTLTAVALTACYIPAHRATKVDPMVALRYE
jgi:putative ABC transport system permease protein